MFELTTTTPTAQIPSGFAMPVCGHASIHATGACTGVVNTGVIVRDRQEDSVRTAVLGTLTAKRDVVRTLAYFPGTTAWRPPIC